MVNHHLPGHPLGNQRLDVNKYGLCRGVGHPDAVRTRAIGSYLQRQFPRIQLQVRVTQGLPDARITVVLRSVNNRFADVRLEVPAELAAWETALRKRCQKVVRRGRLDVGVTIDRAADAEPVPALNRALVEAAVAAARTCREELGIEGKLELSTVLSLPGVFQTPRGEEAPDDDERAAVEQALDRALESIDRERLREGEAMRVDLLERVGNMRSIVEALHERAAETPGQIKERLLERLETLSAEVELDPSRVAQEVAFLADRADVTEELVRLEAHLAGIRTLLSESDDDPVGKRLDFLVQELNRETNTIASKSPDLESNRLALALKAETERVREQVQNLE